MRTRIKLVVQINRDGSWKNGWFRVVGVHYKLASARKRAVRYRKEGYLARVRRMWGFWILAVRKPRKRAPISRDLQA